MPSTLDSCTKFCTATKLPAAVDPGLCGVKGKGPNFLGKLWNLSVTGGQKISALFHTTEFTGAGSTILDTPGMNLFSNICKRFFHRIAAEAKDVTLIDKLYDGDTSITPHSVAKLEEVLKTELAKAKYDKGPLCIPIVLTHKNPLMKVRHIAAVLIADNQVYYYDSKGIASRLRPLQETDAEDEKDNAPGGAKKESIRDFLLMCQKNWTDGTGQIHENPTIHQWDTYNCGAYVSHYLFQRIIMKKSHAELVKADITNAFIHEFRHAMAADLEVPKAPAKKD